MSPQEILTTVMTCIVQTRFDLFYHNINVEENVFIFRARAKKLLRDTLTQAALSRLLSTPANWPSDCEISSNCGKTLIRNVLKKTRPSSCGKTLRSSKVHPATKILFVDGLLNNNSNYNPTNIFARARFGLNASLD